MGKNTARPYVFLLCFAPYVTSEQAPMYRPMSRVSVARVSLHVTSEFSTHVPPCIGAEVDTGFSIRCEQEIGVFSVICQCRPSAIMGHKRGYENRTVGVV